MGQATLLELRGISKHFPGIRALDRVDFKARAGEVHALIGENGAGKSTLVKILTGIYQPGEGQMLLEGKPVVFPSPHESQAAGISAIHQEATMFLELTVTENVFMGHHLLRSGLALVDWAGMEKRTKALLDDLEIRISPRAKVKNLSFAERQMVEIVKALSINTKIVIMDEPTSALTLSEVEHLYRIIRLLKEQGKAVIFISHKFEEIYQIADCYTVLRDGRYIGEGLVATSTVGELVQMMVGRSLNQLFPKNELVPGEVALSVVGLGRSGFFRDITFQVRRGEILGFFGLVGAGRSEVMRAIFGVDRRDEGTIEIAGKAVNIRRPSDALAAGIAFVPEDRQLQGAMIQMSIRENTTLPVIDSLSDRGFLNRRNEEALVERYGTLMQIKASSWEQAVNNLSGGNQQKVVLAKWLATEPKILILDEPTKGIDVGTKAEVHRFISQLAADGIAIVLVSSELPEILGMSDAIVVMHEGRITDRLTRADATTEKVILAATGRPSTPGGPGERHD